MILESACHGRSRGVKRSGAKAEPLMGAWGPLGVTLSCARQKDAVRSSVITGTTSVLSAPRTCAFGIGLPTCMTAIASRKQRYLVKVARTSQVTPKMKSWLKYPAPSVICSVVKRANQLKTKRNPKRRSKRVSHLLQNPSLQRNLSHLLSATNLQVSSKT